MNSGHWQTTIVGDFAPADYFGFVYLVTNTRTGRMYIGKKSMWSTTRKKVKNRKNRKVIVKESSWRTYTTSSKTINAEIIAGEQFKFEIISLHKTKGDLTYTEVEQLVLRDTLRKRFPNGERMYYNAMIPPIRFIPNNCL